MLILKILRKKEILNLENLKSAWKITPLKASKNCSTFASKFLFPTVRKKEKEISQSPDSNLFQSNKE